MSIYITCYYNPLKMISVDGLEIQSSEDKDADPSTLWYTKSIGAN